MRQIEFFDRVIPYCDFYFNKDRKVFCQTQGHIYCSGCNRFLGCTPMYSWRLTDREMILESQTIEIYSAPFFSIKEGYCKCGRLVEGKGVLNNGLKGEL